MHIFLNLNYLQNHTSPAIYQLEFYSDAGNSIPINKSGKTDCPGSDVLENFMLHAS